jgi:tripartite-type tricarboxylate transporter receptor subunit TctC
MPFINSTDMHVTAKLVAVSQVQIPITSAVSTRPVTNQGDEMLRKILMTVSVMASFCHQATYAETFPSKTIRLIVPYQPGGSPDILARTLGQKMSESIGQPVIVENRPGGGGLVASNIVTNSAPDGYTLLVADSSVYSITPSLYRKVNFDPLKVLLPISLAATSPVYLAVNPELKVSNVKELIALAKQKPGLPYGSSGNGSAHHLSMELFKSLSRIDLTHIPYKGASQTAPALVSNEVSLAFIGLNVATPYAKAGKLKVLAIATGQRSSLSPEIPTMAESGVPDFNISITLGVLAPAGTPQSIVKTLNAEVNKAARAPDVQQRLQALGVEGVGSTPEEFTETIRKELASYKKLVISTGAQID